MFGTVELTGNITDLAKYDFWGVMIGFLMVCAVLIVVNYRFQSQIVKHWFKFFGEEVQQLNETIRKMSIQVQEHTSKVAAAIQILSQQVEQLQDDVDELKDGVNSLADTVKEHGEILEDHSAQLAGTKKAARKRGK